MLVSAILLVIALAASPGSAHFLLRLPPSMGYLLDTTGVAPCGGFSFSGNLTGNNYPVKGYPFAATSTVHNVTYTVKVRLLKDPQDTFHEILPPVFVNHYGTFCLPSVPVNRSWIGEPAEYHVVSNDVTSTTYQVCVLPASSWGPSWRSSHVQDLATPQHCWHAHLTPFPILQCSVIRFTDQDAFNSSTRPECKNTSNVVGNLQPWGSNITTRPTMSTASVTVAPTPTDSETSGSRLIGSKLDPWLCAGFSIALGALPFLL